MWNPFRHIIPELTTDLQDALPMWLHGLCIAPVYLTIKYVQLESFLFLESFAETFVSVEELLLAGRKAE